MKLFMELTHQCMACSNALIGRSDKKFCDAYCKSSYHYKKSIDGQRGNFYNVVNYQLKNNRRILSYFNKAGKAVIRSSTLLERGFNPKFFTHYWRNGKGDIYFFVYEYGFLKRKEHGVEKYILIKWQDYMKL